MRKLVTLLLTAAIFFVFIACEHPYEHVFSDEWTVDETYHWHKAECGDTDEVIDKAEHVYKEGKCEVCGHVKPDQGNEDDPGDTKDIYADSDVFATVTEPATDDLRDKAVGLIENFVSGSKGFISGEMYGKVYTAQNNQGESLELKIEGFLGLDINDEMKVSMTKSMPDVETYYVDKDCVIEVIRSKKNYYQVPQMAEFLIGDIFEDIKAQIGMVETFIEQGAEVGYASDGFEIVKVEKQVSASDNARYIFVFRGDELAGLRIMRSYYSVTPVTKQIEILIGDYEVVKPDTSGFAVYTHKPAWAAGYPTEEIFEREYIEAKDGQLSTVISLLRSAVSKLGRGNNIAVLADGDIRFTYKADYSSIDITFDTGDMGMKVREKSEVPLSLDSSKTTTIEHYVDTGICYEVKDGKKTAYLGSYANDFYSMLPYSIMQICEFMSQYIMAYNDGVKNAYDVYICDCEYQAVKMVVEDCAEIFYIFDADGKLLAAKVDMGNEEIGHTVTTLFVGDFNVTIPDFSKVDNLDQKPDISYLGVG